VPELPMSGDRLEERDGKFYREGVEVEAPPNDLVVKHHPGQPDTTPTETVTPDLCPHCEGEMDDFGGVHLASCPTLRTTPTLPEPLTREELQFLHDMAAVPAKALGDDFALPGLMPKLRAALDGEVPGREEPKDDWEPVEWADLQEGDEIRLHAFDMREGWQRETRTVVGRTGDQIRFHCPEYYSNTGSAFDYDYDPATDKRLDRREPERRASSQTTGGEGR
jgi:hypothetical protein